MGLLDETLAQIRPLDEGTMEEAARRWKDLYLGMGDLGKMETMVTQFAGITGEAIPSIPKCCTVIACADHGVYKEGVSAYPQSTTVGMTRAYVETKGAAVNAMAYYGGSDMVVVDMGINADMSGVPGLLDRKIAWGTKDIAEGPAMTRGEAIRSIETGIEIAEEKLKEGYRLFTIGEMGISNTTSSACILGAFNHWNALEVTGRGTNISDERLRHKVEVVQTAMDVNHPDPKDGLDVLSKVGGFEFGCMTGVILGAAAGRGMTIIDGFNTTASAFIAKALAPESVHYLMASHLSLEQAHKKSLAALGLTEYVDLDFRLGEAVGAGIQTKMFDLALSVYRECVTKEEAGVKA
ncbi:nicotinate-nucleotide--dimethylbenzimidazole phosphoribosyltransferase [Dialister sp.]|jgi:nicotinate-nucleotide--dimethylbenzimidazole phosphoribosyltransferase|uniref:nicotinate-nucleotide--dimethylbenzimidazole phosphoribosyltransferase n=1 Tax=Dialister sp. TaxID=1955814 RepID=UPI003A5BBFBD